MVETFGQYFKQQQSFVSIYLHLSEQDCWQELNKLRLKDGQTSIQASRTFLGHLPPDLLPPFGLLLDD